MRQPATQQLYDYWNVLRRARLAPERAEIDPAAIRSILAETFIVDADGAPPFRLRLAGARFGALFAGELKGASFLSLWGEDAPNIGAVLWTVMDGACPVVAGLKAAPPGRPLEDFEMVFLPLRHYGKTHARILGAVSGAAHPPWLGLLPVDRLRLHSLRVMSPEAERASLPLMTPRGTEPGRPAARGHLTVYEGGRSAWRGHAT